MRSSVLAFASRHPIGWHLQPAYGFARNSCDAIRPSIRHRARCGTSWPYDGLPTGYSWPTRHRGESISGARRTAQTRKRPTGLNPGLPPGHLVAVAFIWSSIGSAALRRVLATIPVAGGQTGSISDLEIARPVTNSSPSVDLPACRGASAG